MGRVAVILSGCGFQDGAEIHESVLCYHYLEANGHFYESFAPDIDQKIVIDHKTGEKTEETRNVLVEACRITRGKAQPLSKLAPYDYDALLLPGGFGVVTTLSNFHEDEKNFQVLPELETIIKEFFSLKKSIGATCIAPILLAKCMQSIQPLKMTLGTSKKFFDILKNLNMEPEYKGVDEVCIDENNKIYTTPCYTEPDDLAGLSKGIEKMIQSLLS